MLTLVGKDQACIVAEVTRVLYEQGADLGEASMIRLGGNFTIMLMVNFNGDAERLKVILTPTTKQYQLTMHIDKFDGKLHDHMQADVQICIYGADRSGIVASATDALSAAGLYVLELRTDVAGSSDQPVFIMEIEGYASKGIEALKRAVEVLADLEVSVQPLETLIG